MELFCVINFFQMYDYNEPLEQILFCANASQNLELGRIDDKCNILLKILLFCILSTINGILISPNQRSSRYKAIITIQ